MKSSLVLLFSACVGALAGCSSSPPSGTDERSQADFVNGDFETGNLNAWTVTTHLNKSGIAVLPPQKVADLALTTGGSSFTKTVTGTAPESVLAAGLQTGDTLMYPRFGKYAAVVNELGKNTNSNELFQSLTTTATDIDSIDGKIHIRFVLAPVLQNPGHADKLQPYFYLELRNVTKGTLLFSSFNFSNQAGVPYKSSGGGAVQYTDWQLFDVAPGAAGLAVGDTVTMDIIASGCQPGGHWGHLYVDGFGTFIPGLTVAGSAAQAALAGTNLTYTFQVKNGGAAAASGVTVSDVLPTGTTFVGVSGGPAGTSCTTPAVGATGTVSCNLGALDAAANTSFQITVNINPGSSGTVYNGDYNVRGTGISPLIGPLVNTTIIPSYFITANVTGGNGTLTCQSPVATGTSSVCTITPAAGYGLATLNLDGADVLTAVANNSYTIANVTAAHTVTASFGQVARFNITASSGGNGTLVCQTPVAPGASSVCTVKPDAGYALAALTLDGADVTTDVNGNIYTLSNVMASHAVQATFAPAMYIITTKVLAGQGTLSCMNTLTSGQSSTCMIAPAAGYELTGLYLDGADVLAGVSANTYTIANVMASHLVQAIFAVSQYTITATVPNGNGTLTCQTPVLSGGSSVCTITADAGYALTALTRDGMDVLAAVTNNIYTIGNVTSTHAVQATFGPAMYNITTAVPDGNGTLACTSPLASGMNSVCTITPAMGYGLASLTLDGNSVLAAVKGNTYTIANVTASHLVQANFSQATYNIAATVPGGNGTLSCQSPVTNGESSVCTIKPAPGFVLSGLLLDNNDDLARVNGNAYTIDNVTSSHAVAAAFAPARFTITATAPNGNGSVMCTNSVTYGGSAACSITPDTGYVLVSLTLDGNNVTAGVTNNSYGLANVTASHVVQANFAVAPYKITALVPGGNGQITCTSPVLYGQTAVCQFRPAVGYWLQALTVDGADVMAQVNGNSLAIANVMADHTVQGTFVLSTYNISVSVPGGNGTVTCSTPVSQGGTGTCTVTPATGYLLSTLTLDGADVKAQLMEGTLTVSNVTAAHLVQGTFVQTTNVITVEIPGGNGTITCTNPVLYGQASVCQLTPAAGYQLGNLTLDGMNINAQVAGNSFVISSVTAPHRSPGHVHPDATVRHHGEHPRRQWDDHLHDAGGAWAERQLHDCAGGGLRTRYADPGWSGQPRAAKGERLQPVQRDGAAHGGRQLQAVGFQ